ncbi:MAG: hypothetical protein ACK5YQ_13855, partial [Betaproteobacteria bacterium]
MPGGRTAAGAACEFRRGADVARAFHDTPETTRQRTQEDEETRRYLRRFIDTEINPHVDEWQEAQVFP